MESKFEGKVEESKFSEGDGVTEPDANGWILPGAGDDPSVLARAATWFSKRGKLKMLCDFARSNAHLFVDEVDREDDGSGHSFEHDDCHRQFLEMFEEQLEAFIDEEGFTLDQFQKEAEDLRKGKSLTLFEAETVQHKQFLDTLLASLDFDHFYNTMVTMAKHTNGKHKHCKK